MLAFRLRFFFLMVLAYMIGMKKKKKRVLLSMLLVLIISMSMTVKAAYGLYIDLDVGNYLKSQSEESLFIETNYVDSQSVSITFPEQKRNLIYIS